MILGVDPKVDCAFKHVFGRAEELQCQTLKQP